MASRLCAEANPHNTKVWAHVCSLPSNHDGKHRAYYGHDLSADYQEWSVNTAARLLRGMRWYPMYL